MPRVVLNNAIHPVSFSGWMCKCIKRKFQKGVPYTIICLKHGEYKLIDTYMYVKLSWKGSCEKDQGLTEWGQETGELGSGIIHLIL